jgi:hypothetical protein
VTAPKTEAEVVAAPRWRVLLEVVRPVIVDDALHSLVSEASSWSMASVYNIDEGYFLLGIFET